VAALIGDGSGEGVEVPPHGVLVPTHGPPTLGAQDDGRLHRLLGGQALGQELAAEQEAGRLGPLLHVVEALA